MGAADYRHRVVIESYTESQNSLGEAIKTWGTLATRWAAVEPLTGREFFAADQVQSNITVKIRLRFDGNLALSPKMRCLWDGRYFDIESIQDVKGRRREWVLMCSERQE